MTIMTKTMKASELPVDWQRELGISLDRVVRIEIEEVPAVRSQVDVERLMAELQAIVPTPSDGDVTEFIRAERDRIDGRSGTH